MYDIQCVTKLNLCFIVSQSFKNKGFSICYFLGIFVIVLAKFEQTKRKVQGSIRN